MDYPDNAPYQATEADRHIGSWLEAWVTADTGRWCRFCRVDEARDGGDGDYCSEGCEEAMRTVMQARIQIGERDLEQRGYD